MRVPGTRAGLCGVATAVAVALHTLAAVAQDPVKVKRRTPQGAQLLDFSQARPLSPNPYLSYLPAGTEPDWDYWNAWLKDRGHKRAALLPDPPKLIAISETESNDTRLTANPVTGFGTGIGDDPAADLSGSFPAPPVPTAIGPFIEDDGSITFAGTTGITSGTRAQANQSIGDGPHGSAGTGNGDFDFFMLNNLSAGDVVTIDIDVTVGALDSFVTLWDSTGEIVAFNDDEEFAVLIDSFLQTTVPADGDYYVSVGSFSSPFPLDPFDSSSGIGAGEEGPYSVTIGVNATDLDYFAVDLEAGDVFGANLNATGGVVTLFDPDGVERVGSASDLAGAYPGVSLLPTGGNASLSYVIPVAGTYTLRITGAGAGWGAQFRVFRPVLENAGPDMEQVLFIDFDGVTIDTSIFGGGGTVFLSPLSSFLTNWGLTPGDENAVIDAILATVEENLDTDMQTLGLNAGFGIEILNSRDHADPFGMPNVSRVIVGGTIAQSGIPTIGIAESIDVGNFETEESALVLLDLLSELPSDPNSLNSFPLDGSATIIDIIGVGVGNVVAHEAGHYFGSFHTEQFTTPSYIMDQGGNLPGLLGIGVDGVFGSGDDLDIDFGTDVYVPGEGFTGLEDTLNTTAFGLFSSVGGAAPSTRITSFPSPGFIEDGAPLILSAPAGASGPFQWQKNLGMGLENVMDDARITGSNTEQLQFFPVLASDAGVYFVSYDDGTKAATISAPYTMSVFAPGALPAAGAFAIVSLLAGLTAAGIRRSTQAQHSRRHP